MEPELHTRLNHIIDAYVPTPDLNALLKSCIAEKAREGSVWGSVTQSVHLMLGGEPADAQRRAAVTELMVLALDVMDDLQDQDNPAKPWMSCSPAYALNAVLALAMAAVTESAILPQTSEARPITAQMAALILRSVNGQQKDLNGSVTSEPSYVEMVGEKSGSLMRLAFYLGYAGQAGLDADAIERFEHLADCMGTAAQLRNDLGDVQHYDRKNDLLDKKKTLPVLFLLQHADEDFPPFKRFYEGGISREEFLRLKPECLRFIADSGCVEYSQVIESLFLQRAEEMLESLPGRSPWKEKFRELTIGLSADDADGGSDDGSGGGETGESGSEGQPAQ